MSLIMVLKIIGWVFTVAPVLIFVVISAYIIRGAMGDDDAIKSLVMIGFTFFFLGLIILLLIYLTNIFQAPLFG